MKAETMYEFIIIKESYNNFDIVPLELLIKL